MGIGYADCRIQWFFGGGGPPSLGTLEDRLGKSPDTGTSLHGSPVPSEGNLVCGGWARILGTLIDD
jgi:hypothetical protein